jgi:hypothetical protein
MTYPENIKSLGRRNHEIADGLRKGSATTSGRLDAEYTREIVAAPCWQYPHGNVEADECVRDLADRAVAANHDNHRGARVDGALGQLASVSRELGLED